VVWLKVPISKTALVPEAVKAGFMYHHADESYVMLTHRLVESAVIPPHATHYVGVGGVVLNDTRELLVISERYRRRSSGPSYKIPGGALHPGEHIAQGIIREVLEETGIETRFESLVCFRHWHGYRFGKSDIYFVCRLTPLSHNISMQVEEIEECMWMPLEKFLLADHVHPFNKSVVRAALAGPGIVPGIIEGHGDPDRFEFLLPREAL
jgi:8-oxo-dGTP diphosphatase